MSPLRPDAVTLPEAAGPAARIAWARHLLAAEVTAAAARLEAEGGRSPAEAAALHHFAEVLRAG